MTALGKEVRKINSPNELKGGEYLVVMKTSTKIRPDGTEADYHFARQLSNGMWADKPGLEPARWNVLGDPEHSWYYLNWADYYNTKPKYFAVKE